MVNYLYGGKTDPSLYALGSTSQSYQHSCRIPKKSKALDFILMPTNFPDPNSFSKDVSIFNENFKMAAGKILAQTRNQQLKKKQ